MKFYHVLLHIIIAINLVLTPLLVISQTENIRFANIDVQDGLSANWITSLHRDSDGFIWIGTRRGLNRFDGYNSIVYETNSANSLTLTNNIINCITEDKKSNLWVGTSFGLNVKNNNTNKFEQINLFDYNAFNCNDINTITSLLASKNGAIYIGTHEGYFIYKDSEFTHHLIDSSDFSSPKNYILSFAEDVRGNIWMRSNSRDIYSMISNSNKIEHFVLPNLKAGLYSSGIYQIFIDDKNKLWIGTQSGLFVFDISTRKWENNLNQFLDDKIGAKVITGIQQDRDSKIWISTDGAGLFVLNSDKNLIRNIHHQVFNSNSLSTDGLYSLLIDNDDIVWVGTYKQGLDYYKRNSQKILLLRKQPGNKNSLASNDINCIIEDSDKNLWFGTNGNGISILNRKTQTYQHISRQFKNTQALSSDVVVSLFEDSRKNIWIGTYLGGLNKYNPFTGEIKIYKHSAEDSTTISDDRVWSITEDDENNLWIGTMGGGLNKYNPENNTFKRYTASNSNIPGNFINHVLIDSKKRLWISSSDGLCLYNSENDNFDVFINPQGETGDNLFGIQVSAYEDSRNLLWLCTSNGLIQFNYDSKTATYINSENGLRSDPVYQVLEDRHKNLWISSSNGLTKITVTNIVSSDNFTVSFSHFDETDGLQNNEFSETAALKTSNGELIFGGVDGINIFYPEKIINEMEDPDLVFLNLKIFNETVVPNQTINNRILIEKPLNKTDEIVLNYSENFFSIEFAVLNYISSDKNKYRYRLFGFDENWFETTGLNNYATYTNLNNGQYTFEVIRANLDGSWNEESISLQIIVRPPIWKSWYAFVFYVAFLSMILFVLRYMILSKERLQVKFEHKSLEAERIHELDLAKIKFFTNVSHEFRTPLSLILLPIEKLMPKYKDKPDGKYLNHIYVNSKKLLYLINQLLDFRKMEISGLTYNPSLEDVISFINNVVEMFNDLSENKNISLRMVTDIKRLIMLFDKDKMEKILYNLLSNAFKFTPANGLVLIELSVVNLPKDKRSALKKHLVIKIKDNGIGINKDLISKIFTRFYQAKSKAQVEVRGTGIGLSMVKEYVAVHKGIIEVESATGVGTSFIISLPVEAEGGMELKDITKTTILDSYNKNTQLQKQYELTPLIDEDKPVVLIVEDNDELRIYLKDNLSDNYNILEAENGKEGWSMLKNSMPDIVLSDIMMPEMDGIELCKLAKSNNITCHIPFVFLTAKNTEQQQLEGLETGADDYISKPFNIDILEKKIRNLVQLKLNIQKILNTKLKIEPKDISITSLDNKFMEQALGLIEKNIADTAFTVEEFSRKMGISRMQLYKKLVSLTGKTPLEFIRIFRLKRAAQFLKESQLTISEIAYQVGFNDPKNFSKHFRKVFKMLPSKYLKQHKEV